MTSQKVSMLSLALLAACAPDRPRRPPDFSSVVSGGSTGETGDASPQLAAVDGGGAEPAMVDGGPGCPPLTAPAGSACTPEVKVRLTGTAFAIRGDTLIAGIGQQPVLQTFVSAPQGTALSSMTLSLRRSEDGGGSPFLTQTLSSAQVDDAGVHFDFPWNTAKVPEGRYAARSRVMVADGGYLSNEIWIEVDRTPPVVSVALDVGPFAPTQLRNAKLGATVSAFDDGGIGIASMDLQGSGWQLPGGLYLPGVSPSFKVAAVDVPLPLASVSIDRTAAAGRAAVDLTAIPYDAWSTATDGLSVTLTATVCDLAGNVGTGSIAVPLTREQWTNSQTILTGQPIFGGHGEILWVDQFGLSTLAPVAGASPTLTSLPMYIGGAGQGSARVDPATGDTTVFQIATTTTPAIWSAGQSLVVAYDGGVASQFPPVGEALVGRPAIASSLGSLVVAGATCDLWFFDLGSGAVRAPRSGSGSCPDPATNLAISPAGILLTNPEVNAFFRFGQSGADWMQQTSAQLGSPNAGAVGSDKAWIGEATGLGLLDLSTEIDNVPHPAPLAVSTVSTSSRGEVVLTTNNSLIKLYPSGDVQWTSTFVGPIAGPVLGADGTIYVVDGRGSLVALDFYGRYHWASPPNYSSTSFPLLDPCTQAAYLRTASGSIASIVLDEAALDSANQAWPMPGHDVFQTSDVGSTVALDCAKHW